MPRLLCLFLGMSSWCTICEAVDLRMLSATMSDSSKIRIEYEIVAGPLASPAVPVHLYRSADTALDLPDDRLLMEGVLTGTANGVHVQELTLPEAGRGMATGQPHVLAVLDPPTNTAPSGVVIESDETNNQAEFRKYALAVIVHGLTFYEGPPEWVDLIAASLTDRGYDLVVPVDWAMRSRVIWPGVPQSVGAGLAHDLKAAVAELPARPQDRVDVHWIGHSRGTVVVSQALLAWGRDAQLPDSIKSGWMKVTYLDPHPAKNRNPPLISVNRLNPLGPLLAFGTQIFQSIVNDPDLTLPTGLIDETELYFQRTEWYLLSPNEVYFDYLANYWGEAPLPGFPLNKTFNVTQPRLSHFEVPNYYLDNVLNREMAGSRRH